MAPVNSSTDTDHSACYAKGPGRVKPHSRQENESADPKQMSECEFRTTQQTSKGESGTTQADIEVSVLHRSAEVRKRVLAHFTGDIALFETCSYRVVI